MDDKFYVQKTIKKNKEKILITASYFIIYPLIIFVFLRSFQLPDLTITSSTLMITLLIVPLAINAFFYEMRGALVLTIITIELSFVFFAWMKGGFQNWSMGEKLSVFTLYMLFILVGVIAGRYK